MKTAPHCDSSIIIMYSCMDGIINMTSKKEQMFNKTKPYNHVHSIIRFCFVQNSRKLQRGSDPSQSVPIS